jgi:hypothetical protein
MTIQDFIKKDVERMRKLAPKIIREHFRFWWSLTEKRFPKNNL